MEEKDILNDNYKEYFQEGNAALTKENYNTAVTLFFKAMSAAADLFILNKEGFVPSSHTHRFRVLQQKYTEVYEILDRDFPFYQESYTKRMDKEAAELLKEDAERINELTQK